MKKVIVCYVIFLCLFFARAFSQADSFLMDMDLMKQSAQRDFPKFIQAALRNKSDYGFKEEDSIDNISLVDPVCVWNLNKEYLENITNIESIDQGLEPTNECLFPVVINSEYRTLFAVRKRGSIWKGSYLGNPLLAKNLQELRSFWSKDGKDLFKLVSCVFPRSFWYVLVHETTPNLTPLTEVSLDGESIPAIKDVSSWVSAEKMITRLKTFWQENGL